MIESMKQALEALEYVKKTYDEQGLVSLGTNTAIIDLRQAIAEAEKQPKREWVGLTDEELYSIYNQADWNINEEWNYERAIEAKLKEKNT